MNIEFHPLTASDLNHAKIHYNQKRSGLGDEFRSEVYAAIDRILRNPRQYPIIEQNIRRCLVHRFPYSIYFRLFNSGTIRVLVIRHHKRHPRLGLSRD
ncbi:MAG: type II toxin-antitoxin system RelE/ParE family toxin [Nitrospira sp.]|nr:type II toxin-antitoxin system RelE/ParE family toxin [Nitrospira sp.]